MSAHQTTDDAEFRRFWFERNAARLDVLKGQCLSPLSGGGTFKFCHNFKAPGADCCEDCANGKR